MLKLRDLTRTISAMPPTLLGLAGVLALMPVWSLLVHGSSLLLAFQAADAAARMNLALYWLLPLATLASMLVKGRAFIVLIALFVVAMALRLTSALTGLADSQRLLGLVLLASALLLSVTVSGRDSVYPFLDVRQNPRRCEPLPVDCA